MNVTEYLTCWAASYKNDLINNKQTGILKMKIKSK